jgi:uncharacterized membrane protein (UPF0127 family)
MKMLRVAWWLCLSLAVLPGCRKAAETAGPAPDPFEPTQAQPRLETVKVWLGAEQLTAEMAATPKAIMTGMMFRTSMEENEAMIFSLGMPQQAHFWMKNCYVPLSVAYIDPNGVIQEIHDMEPHNTNTVDSVSKNVSFALETRQGWFKRHGIQEGTMIRTEHGTLMETLGQQR